MPNTYIDIFDYLRSTSGLEYQSLLGNTARFTTVQAQGTTVEFPRHSEEAQARGRETA